MSSQSRHEIAENTRNDNEFEGPKVKAMRTLLARDIEEVNAADRNGSKLVTDKILSEARSKKSNNDK